MLFIATIDAPLDLRQLVDHRPDGREVGVAGVGRRRPDGHVDEVRIRNRLSDVRREAEPLTVSLQQLVETRLVDRHLAAAECVDSVGEDVADDDLVAEVGEARAGDEADVAGAEDSHPAHGGGAYPLTLETGRRPFAIAIIVSFDSRSRSVLTTQ